MREVFKNIQDEKTKLPQSTLNVLAGLPIRPVQQPSRQQKSGKFSFKKLMIALPCVAAVVVAAILIPMYVLGLGRDYAIGNITGSGTIGEADYVMLQEYIENKIDLTEKQIKAADLNGDGVIDKLDLLILRRYLDYKDITLPCNVKSGDINGDGEVARKDAILLIEYLEGMITLTPEQQLAADFNCDGVIDDLDLLALLAIIAGV